MPTLKRADKRIQAFRFNGSSTYIAQGIGGRSPHPVAGTHGSGWGGGLQKGRRKSKQNTPKPLVGNQASKKPIAYGSKQTKAKVGKACSQTEKGRMTYGPHESGSFRPLTDVRRA